MNSQVVFIFIIFIIIVSSGETKVWDQLMDTETKDWDSAFDANFIKFTKTLSSLNYTLIGSDCAPNVDFSQIFQNKNEDIDLNGFQILKKHNLKIKVYTVKTCDGYLLTFVRIPGKGPVVLVNHGLLSSFIDFFTSGTKSGLGYLLHRAGYDVWLANCRGNTYSRNHTKLSPKDKKFWNFSWHEIGTRDLPAFIDFALRKTGKKQLIYIGFSQGTTSIMVLLSEKPKYNKKLKLVILLSPVAFLGNAISPILRALAPFEKQEEFILSIFGQYDLLPRVGFVSTVKDIICYPTTTVCDNFVFLLLGFDCKQLNDPALPVQYAHIPSGASVKQLMHYFQLINSNRFQKYDYGKKKNLKVYKREQPPDYNLTNIRAPIALFSANNDWIADTRDVKKLIDMLPNVVEDYLVPFDTFNHIDFLWAKDVKKLLYWKVLELIDKFNKC